MIVYCIGVYIYIYIYIYILYIIVYYIIISGQKTFCRAPERCAATQIFREIPCGHENSTP